MDPDDKISVSVRIGFSRAEVRILDDLRGGMEWSRPEAIRFLIADDLAEWKNNVMSARKPKDEEGNEIG